MNIQNSLFLSIHMNSHPHIILTNMYAVLFQEYIFKVYL